MASTTVQSRSGDFADPVACFCRILPNKNDVLNVLNGHWPDIRYKVDWREIMGDFVRKSVWESLHVPLEILEGPTKASRECRRGVASRAESVWLHSPTQPQLVMSRSALKFKTE